MNWSGGTWSATANSLAFGGTPACSGGLLCRQTRSYPNPLWEGGPWTYKLSGDCNTLTIAGANLTLARN